MAVFWINRWLTVAVWAFHVTHWVRSGAADSAFLNGFFLLIPVVLIWFADEIGAGSGYDVEQGPATPLIDISDIKGKKRPVFRIHRLHRSRVDVPTEGIVIKFFGWILLLTPWWLPFLMAPRYLSK